MRIAWYSASCGLVVLADGMGGYKAGEVASGITVSVMATEIRDALQHTVPQTVMKGAAKTSAWCCCATTCKQPHQLAEHDIIGLAGIKMEFYFKS